MATATSPDNEFALTALADGFENGLASRAQLTARLSELVTWPATRMQPHERQLAADVLMGLMRSANAAVREKLAERLARVEDAPKALLRYLARDEITVARKLLEEGIGFDDSDLVSTIRHAMLPHWRAIAGRKGLTEIVTEALLQTGEPEVVRAVLANQHAKLSQPGVDFALAASRRNRALVDLLLQRPELRPTQALVLFWWSDFPQRSQIVRRYAAERQTLITELADLFAMASREDWQDSESRKALQVIEPRQRNRAALSRSPFASLEEAVAASEVHGMTKKSATEIGYLCGLKPMTIIRIFADKGGEPIGVLAKAVGLKRASLDLLWGALRRSKGNPALQDTPYGRTLYIFDVLSSAKAQTALRYWNWSFSAEAEQLTVEDLQEQGDSVGITPARRNAALLNLRVADD
jgi:uncharacterized protein (DUF2336 family)